MSEKARDADRLERLLLGRRLETFVAGSTQALAPAIFSVLVLLLTFHDEAPPLILSTWAVLLIAINGLRAWISRRMDPPLEDLATMRRHWRQGNLVLHIGSLAWAVSFPFIAWYGGGLEIAVLGVIGTAMFIGVLLIHRTAPRAGTVHVVLLALGLMAAAVIVGGSAAWPVLLVLAVFAVTLIEALRLHERAFVTAVSSEMRREDSEATVRMLLNEYESQASDWLWAIGPKGNLRNVSGRLAEVLENKAENLEGVPLLSLFDPGPNRDRITRAIATQTPFRDELIGLRIGEEQHYWRLSARPREDGGMAGVGRDVTKTRQIEERVAYMAHYDGLTGLANRYLFNERLRGALGPDGGNARKVALFYLDLDDFQGVNDTHGHAFGDALLRQVGSRLEQEVRDGDLVARLGGDEFAVLIETGAGDGMLIERAHRFLSVVREPFEIERQLFRVSASVGVARCEADRCEAEELMRRADLALHAAKTKGRDEFAMFDHALDRAAQQRRQTESDLRDALANDELRLHYQPVIDLDSGATVAYEALVRWKHPTKGMLFPDHFLQIAEDTGLIVPLGDWVIRRALSEMAGWEGDFRIAINLSPSQMRNPRLVAIIEDALGATGIHPRRIEFEITEHVLLQTSDVGLGMMTKLRELGAGIALDDFGTGYSSLSYLRNFPFDRIKIDRSFVSDVTASDTARAIVSTITRLADALGARTTAEGVEQPDQLDLLRKLGCHEAQGFLILEPVSAERLDEAHGKGIDLPDLGNEVLDYRKARQAALRRKGIKLA